MPIMKLSLSVFVFLLAGITPSLAHIADIAHEHSFVQGFVHPLTGLDHLLAMLTLGLWAGGTGGHARWLWPVTFVAVAGVGAIFAQVGFVLPAQEPLIAMSVIALGGLLYIGMHIPLLAGMLVSAAAAFAHGYAHGVEMPLDSTIGGFMAGFMLATAGLHFAGLLVAPRFSNMMRKITGGLIAFCGAWLLALV